jgi:hypothetical protein
MFDPLLGSRKKFRVKNEKSEQIKEIDKKIRKLEKKVIRDFLKKIKQKPPIENDQSFKGITVFHL